MLEAHHYGFCTIQTAATPKEATGFSETFIPSYETTWHHITQYPCTLRIGRHDNQLSQLSYKYTMMYQTQQNFIMFIIVLGQHVSILIE